MFRIKYILQLFSLLEVEIQTIIWKNKILN